MFSKSSIASLLLVSHLVVLPAGATQYHWTGNASTTDWFTAENWSKGTDPDPFPRKGDSPRIGVQANNYPTKWPHYTGTNVLGGVEATDGAFLIGGVTNAWFYLEGGYLQHNSWVNIGQSWPYTGCWIQTGGIFDSSSWVRQFTVASGGNGELTITGGAIQVDNFAIIRNNPGANPAPTNAWVLLTGTGRISCSSAYIGIYGTAATLTNRDGALFSVTNSLTLGRSEGGIGHVYQEGGLVLAGSSTETGVDLYTAGSEYVLSGGTLLASFVGSTYNTSGGAFVFDGGTLKARGTSQRLLRPVASVTINAGKTALIDTAGYYERAQAALTGTGGLTKLGAGTLTLEGMNTYTGPTLVSSGTLLFAEAQTLGAVTVSDGAAVGTDLDTPDRQAVLSSLALGSNSVLSFVLSATDNNPAPARLAASAVTLNGPAIVSVATGAVLLPGIYALLDYDTISGSGSLTLGPLPCGMQATLVTNGTLLELDVTQGASAPVIATAPASQAVLQNRPVTFSVALTECAEFASYQWVFNSTNYLPDATNATYAISLAQTTNQGAYQVIVANEIGSVTSTPPAILTVNADAVPPFPLSATRPYGLSTNVIVTFDELLDATSAQLAANYNLSNATAGVNVGTPDAAVLLPDQRTVRLTFAEVLADNTLYKLRATGVKDLALNPQTGASIVVTLHGVLSPVGAARLVVMEAEEADEITASAAFDGNQRSWEIAADRPGYSGWAALQCLPNFGHSGNPTSQGPVASFTVDFPAGDTYPITYYLWIRGAGATPEDDSCQATLDWLDILSPVLAPSMSQNLYQPSGGWGWVGNCSQGGYGRAQFVLTNSGLHKVSLLMREDGFCCDKLVLTTDSAYAPASVNNGLGPDTLTRGVYPAAIAFVPGTLVLSGGTFKMNVQTVAGLLNIIEWKNTLGDPSWTVLTSFTGDGSVQTITDSNPPPGGRFYQARVVIP